MSMATRSSWLLRSARTFASSRFLRAPSPSPSTAPLPSLARPCHSPLRLRIAAPHFSSNPSRRHLSSPGGPDSVRPAAGTGGGQGGWRSGAGGGQSWTGYWPLGVAGVTLVMTGQASRAIDMDRTYDQLAQQVGETPTSGSASKQHFAGGLSSIIQWLHLFGTGPAGQELRRRMVVSGCVDAVLRQEELWNRKVAEATRLLSGASPNALQPGGEVKKQVMQAYWMRETCLLALSELLLGSDSVRDVIFGNKDGILQRLLQPARDDSTVMAMKIVHESSVNKKRPMKDPVQGFANPADPLQMQNHDFGAISKGLPDHSDLWSDGGVSSHEYPLEGGTAAGGAGGVADGSRIWSVSQVRVLQVLAKDARLGTIVSQSPDAVACFAENLEPSKEAYSGFTKILDMDRQRRVLKCLSDVAKHVSSSPRSFEDPNLQQALVELCKSPDVVTRNLSLACVKSLSNAGASFSRFDDGTITSQPITAIATQDDLKAASREIHYTRLMLHAPVVMACGAAYGTLRQYLKLRGRTVIAMPNLAGNATTTGLATAIGSCVTYLTTVHLMKFLHKHNTETCNTPSEVVSATGNSIAAEFGMIWAVATMFPHSFGGFVLGNLVLAQLAFVHPAAFGPVLVPAQTRERAY